MRTSIVVLLLVLALALVGLAACGTAAPPVSSGGRTDGCPSADDRGQSSPRQSTTRAGLSASPSPA